MADNYNSSTWEVEIGGPAVQGQSQLHQFKKKRFQEQGGQWDASVVSAAKPRGLNSVSRTHRKEREKRLPRLLSDFHSCAGHMQTHI